MSKVLRLLVALLVAATVVPGSVLAQRFRLPVLVVPKEEKAEPLKLAAIKTRVQVLGYLAETRMTMTFFNPNNRVLAGDLYFPLPEGATVSGYALDIGGVMVDGVVVDKHKGRQVYEKIVRQGIDPGLVEWVKGNNFKTRVFPIMPRGRRTVMVRYISELVHDPKGTTYHLPLGLKDPVDEFSLRVEVVKPASKPVISQGAPANFSFEKWRENYVAETTLKNQAFDKELVIALPDVERQKVLVEKDSDGGYHFVVNDFPKVRDKDKPKIERKSPGRIVIFWDASGSRGKGDHKRELKLLEQYLAAQKDKKLQVDLVVFRNEAEKAEQFIIEKGDSKKLIAAISAIEYDGGTQMGCIAPESGPNQPDLYLLFSDGISNFGKEEPEGFKAPIYAISEDPSTNHSFLRYLCLQTGGEYFNLNKLDDETVLSGIGASPYSFISATSEGGGVDETYPKASQPVYGRFSLAGKLNAEKAKITLNYGVKGQVLAKTEYQISRADTVDGELLRLFWAQKKIDELQVFLKRNEKELIAVGKDNGLVTPGTSLIVLEGLQQYVEHKIAPPKSLSDMRTRYFAMIDDQQSKQQRRVVDKLEQVVAMWERRVGWWNTDFKAPKDFKYEGRDFNHHYGAPAQGSRMPIVSTPPGWERAQEGMAETSAARRPGAAAAPRVYGAAPSASAPVPGPVGAAPGASPVGPPGWVERKDSSQPAPATAPKASGSGSPSMVFGKLGRPREASPAPTMAPLPSALAPQAAPHADRLERMSDERLRAKLESRGGGKGGSVRLDHLGARMEREAPAKQNVSAEPGTRGDIKLASPQPVEPDKPVSPQSSGEGSISIRAWDPSTPYLTELKGAKADNYLKVYMEQRKKYSTSPAFYLDCANFLFEQKQEKLAVRVLSNIAELELENPQLLRVLGHRLAQANLLEPARMVFEEVLRLRPEEPQSYRDLALVLDSLGEYRKAIDLLYQVVTGKWDRFPEIEVPVLMELNRIIARAKRAGIQDFPVDPRLIKLLDLDMRIVLTWDADMTDLDLWVVEPSGEKCFYQHKLTTIGGLISRDITDGYGPEEYVLKKAMKGKYQVQTQYFGSSAPSLAGAVTLQVDVFTNYGRENEQRRSITLRLKQRREVVSVGEVDFQ